MNMDQAHALLRTCGRPVDVAFEICLAAFTEHDILSVAHDNYGLVDEFLRIRILFDSERNEEDRKLLESRIIDETSTEEFAEAEFFESDDDDLHPPMYEDPEMESDED